MAGGSRPSAGRFEDRTGFMIYLVMRAVFLVLLAVAAVAFTALVVPEAQGFGELGGSCEAECSKCHSLSMAEATEIVKEVNPEIDILEVSDGPVRGLWELTIKARGVKSLAYVDFAKKHIITGSVLEVETRKNLTNQRLYDINKVDVDEIPLVEALVLGKAGAPNRVIVFDDPD